MTALTQRPRFRESAGNVITQMTAKSPRGITYASMMYPRIHLWGIAYYRTSEAASQPTALRTRMKQDISTFCARRLSRSWKLQE